MIFQTPELFLNFIKPKNHVLYTLLKSEMITFPFNDDMDEARKFWLENGAKVYFNETCWVKNGDEFYFNDGANTLSDAEISRISIHPEFTLKYKDFFKISLLITSDAGGGFYIARGEI